MRRRWPEKKGCLWCIARKGKYVPAVDGSPLCAECEKEWAQEKAA